MDVVWTFVTTNAAALSALIAVVALGVTVWTQMQQRRLTKQLYEQQTLFQQRQLIVPMWEYLDRTSFLNTSQPVWEDVRKAANTLELVAVCWEASAIDPDVIRRIFGDTFIELYESIDQCQNPPANFPYDGRALLRRAPATQKLYEELKREHMSRGQIPPIPGQRRGS